MAFRATSTAGMPEATVLLDAAEVAPRTQNCPLADAARLARAADAARRRPAGADSGLRGRRGLLSRTARRRDRTRRRSADLPGPAAGVGPGGQALRALRPRRGARHVIRPPTRSSASSISSRSASGSSTPPRGSSAFRARTRRSSRRSGSSLWCSSWRLDRQPGRSHGGNRPMSRTR